MATVVEVVRVEVENGAEDGTSGGGDGLKVLKIIGYSESIANRGREGGVLGKGVGG